MNLKTDTLGQRMATSTTPVFEFEGRWYIAMGQPGYNSLANNRNGYATQGRADAAIRSYADRRPGAARRVCHFGECGQPRCTGCGVPLKS